MEVRKPLEWSRRHLESTNDDTVDEQMDEENRRGTPAFTKHALAVTWASVTSALVDHHQFGTVDHN